jgi:hypothetical protein
MGVLVTLQDCVEGQDPASLFVRLLECVMYNRVPEQDLQSAQPADKPNPN